MLILSRALKKDNCTNCTTTFSTTLVVLCNKIRITALPAEMLLNTRMVLKLILHRIITISDKRSLVIINKFQMTLFVLLSRFQRISSHLYIKEWRPTSEPEHKTLQLIYKQYKNPQCIQTHKARLSTIQSSYSVIVLFFIVT